DPALLDLYRNRATVSYGIDAVNEELIRQKVPSDVDAAIVDLGDKTEASILATSYLKKMGIRNIVVKAERESLAEVLELVGATRVVFPSRDTAKRLAAQLLAPSLLQFIAIGGGLVIAQMVVPARFVGETLADSDIRRKYDVNILASKASADKDFTLIKPDHIFLKDEIILALLEESRMTEFSEQLDKDSRRSSLSSLFRVFFPEAH
ncbi:MAG: NAD-binding protein, partial [Spirochaeta sp.]